MTEQNDGVSESKDVLMMKTTLFCFMSSLNLEMLPLNIISLQNIVQLNAVNFKEGITQPLVLIFPAL